MQTFNTKIEGHLDQIYTFECYDNTEPIDIGDAFIFFFAGIADVQRCDSESGKYEINKNDRIKNPATIDLVTGFWKRCYKIKNCDFDLSLIE